MSPTKVSEIAVEDSSMSVEPCTLPKNVQQVALDELREDEHTRTQCLLAFRQWISQNTDIQNINTGITVNFMIRPKII